MRLKEEHIASPIFMKPGREPELPISARSGRQRNQEIHDNYW